MWTSLFGDLGTALGSAPPAARDDFGTAMSSFRAPAAGVGRTEPSATGTDVEPHVGERQAEDLLVGGSPAQAMRAHLAATRSDLDTASPLITLLDPADLWASATIRALSDAGGQPIERLHLRERATERVLATIERTSLVRRHGDRLRICHAAVRAPGRESAEIPIALMECSQMAVVIVGPLDAPAVDALLKGLQAATMLPSWRCPNLLLLLPPGAFWIGAKVGAIGWPARLHVEAVDAAMTGASSVWNTLLGVWNRLGAGPTWETPAPPSSRFGDLPGWASDTDPAAARADRPDAAHVRIALAGMLAIDGLVGCALVEVASGAVLGREAPEPAPDLDEIAALAASLLREHPRAVRRGEPIDEVLLGAGRLRHLIRPLPRHPGLGLVAVLDRAHANLSLARLQITEVERRLG